MCNKVDIYPQFFYNGLPMLEQFFKYTKYQYPHIFGNLKNRNLTTKIFSPYLFDFVAFSAGHFYQQDYSLYYTPSNDIYPATLWKTILKAVKM